MVIFCTSCYKAGNVKDTSSPNFCIICKVNGSSYHGENGGNIKDSIIKFNVNDSSTLDLNFQFSIISGTAAGYPITCLLKELPAGITATTDSFTFRLNYNFTCSLKIAAGAGDYVIYATVETISGSNRYPIHIHVSPAPTPSDCAPNVVAVYSSNGNYVNRSTGAASSDSCTVSISIMPGQAHWVIIKNLRGIGDSFNVSAYVNCDGNITIPLQTSYGYSIYGLGGYGKDICDKMAINFHDTIIHATDTFICTAYLRQ